MIDNKIDLPSTSSDVLIKYKEDYLTEYEISEIVEFD